MQQKKQKPKVRLLVCGGRDFGAVPADTPAEDIIAAMVEAHKQQALLAHVLTNIRREKDIEVIIEGGAGGADHHAGEWADANHIPHLTYPADWKKHGKKAGPIRNQQMLDVGKPTLVVAFPGKTGTADMVKRSKKAGIEVMEIEYVG